MPNEGEKAPMLQLENVFVVEPSGEVEAVLDAFLDERIYEFNMQATGLCDGKPFVGVIKDDSVAIVAAINGHTWGGCCYVAHLWVHESYRRQGLGRALLLATEAEAVRRGCTQVVLWTHSFQAPAFYEQLGYARQATVPNYPNGHAQYVYLKSLRGLA
jgi:ribosomal protein S18 acetylase RimI-like enzyme